MKKLKLIGLFVGGFVVGAIAAGWWAGYVFSRITVSKEVDAAFIAAQEAEWLAELRLNEPKSAIEDMETSMDIGVSTIAVWSEIRPLDEKTHKARDRFLTAVKVYHESYPASGDVAARVNSLLATVPGRNPQNTCKSGICRLDDLRLATLHTNSP
jgi:hypothetical protein